MCRCNDIFFFARQNLRARKIVLVFLRGFRGLARARSFSKPDHFQNFRVSYPHHACANNRSLQLKFEASLPISHRMTFNFDLLLAPGPLRCVKEGHIHITSYRFLFCFTKLYRMM